MRARLIPCLLLAILVAVPTAMAHGTAGGGAPVETGSLPAWVLWAAGAAVVGLSFALVALILTREDETRSKTREPVQAGPVTGIPRNAVGLARLLGLLFLLVIIASALVPWNPGTGPGRLFWLGFWATGTLVAYTVGNVWVLVSPFRALAGLAERFRGRTPPFAYPEGWGTWPCTILLLGLIGLESLAPSASWLGRIAIVYTTFTLVGMITFGAQTWLRQAEVFDRVFAWWSTLAPAQYTSEGLAWGWPGRAVDDADALDASDAAFVVGLVYATNADGFLSTSLATSLQAPLGSVGSLLPLALVLLLGFLLFFGLFWACAALVRAWTQTPDPIGTVTVSLAATLVPIAIGYHLAHNLAYIIDGLPLLVDALADPVNVTPASATAWTVMASRPLLVESLQILFVLLGHIAAVLLAHRRSFTMFPSKVQVIKTELPLTGAMVVYTLTSLWIVTSAHTGGAL